MPSLRPSLRAPAWVCPSVAPSSNLMADICGLPPTQGREQLFSSPCAAKLQRIRLRSQATLLRKASPGLTQQFLSYRPQALFHSSALGLTLLSPPGDSRSFPVPDSFMAQAR